MDVSSGSQGYMIVATVIVALIAMRVLGAWASTVKNLRTGWRHDACCVSEVPPALTLIPGWITYNAMKFSTR